jgi:hypothetical protein
MDIGQGKKCSNTNRGLFHSQNSNFPELCFILINLVTVYLSIDNSSLSKGYAIIPNLEGAILGNVKSLRLDWIPMDV